MVNPISQAAQTNIAQHRQYPNVFHLLLEIEDSAHNTKVKEAFQAGYEGRVSHNQLLPLGGGETAEAQFQRALRIIKDVRAGKKKDSKGLTVPPDIPIAITISASQYRSRPKMAANLRKIAKSEDSEAIKAFEERGVLSPRVKELIWQNQEETSARGYGELKALEELAKYANNPDNNVTLMTSVGNTMRSHRDIPQFDIWTIIDGGLTVVSAPSIEGYTPPLPSSEIDIEASQLRLGQDTFSVGGTSLSVPHAAAEKVGRVVNPYHLAGEYQDNYPLLKGLGVDMNKYPHEKYAIVDEQHKKTGNQSVSIQNKETGKIEVIVSKYGNNAWRVDYAN